MNAWEIAALVVAAIAMVAAAVLAAAETSMTNLTRARASVLEHEGRPRAAILLSLLERREQVLNPVLLLRLFGQVLVAGVLSVLAYRRWGIPGAVVGALLAEILLFIVAEAIPRRWALTDRDAAALSLAPMVRGLNRLPLDLVTRFLIKLSEFLLPGGGGRGAVVSEDELLAVAEWAAIEASERELIEATLDLGDTIVRAVMVPRPDMENLEADTSIADAIDRAIELGLSRFPVLGESVDDVVGVAYLKDLIRAERNGRGADQVTRVAHPPNFVPETKRAPELLAEMRKNRVHLAIVIDEHGGVAGLVTLEDLLEELVGEIADEFDAETPLIVAQTDGSTLVDGRTASEDFGELLGVEFPHEDWDTVGGLVMDRLGRVPDPDDGIEVAGRQLDVVQVEGNRITLLRLAPAPAAAPTREVADLEREQL